MIEMYFVYPATVYVLLFIVSGRGGAFFFVSRTDSRAASYRRVCFEKNLEY